MRFIAVLIFSILLTGCISAGRYSQHNDSAPTRKPTQLEMTDAEVTNEPITRGTKPYTIRGITYTPHTKRQAFSQTGVASWYGEKFHGHLTANGETYDMYAMTAAHKTLPLPSFVKVTNLENGRSAIVRVNDRGPFHDNRIIDLSYSAAHKIGVFDTGTAKVKIDVLLPNQNQQLFEVALTGFTSESDAAESAKGLSLLLHQEAKTVVKNNKSVLVFGPFKHKQQAKDTLSKVKQFGFTNAKIITSTAK